MKKKIMTVIITVAALAMTACGQAGAGTGPAKTEAVEATKAAAAETVSKDETKAAASETVAKDETKAAAAPADRTAEEKTAAVVTDFSQINADELFTERDLENSPDVSQAEKLTVGSGDITIDKEGIYVLGGTAENVTVYVDAGSEDKVQLVLDG
nr:carbohydrate-binding domain-containing protein [Lachnospiraceae bacterium]